MSVWKKDYFSFYNFFTLIWILSSSQLQSINRFTRSTSRFTVSQHCFNVILCFSTILIFSVNCKFTFIFCWSSQLVSLSASISAIFSHFFQLQNCNYWLSSCYHDVSYSFYLEIAITAFQTFYKRSSFEKSLSTIRLFLGKPSNLSIYNSERTVALAFPFSLGNPTTPTLSFNCFWSC